MTSRSDKRKRAKLQSIARAVENKRAKEAGEMPSAGPKLVTKPPRERKGLEWLLHKKRITARQFWAGTEYGNLYRAVAAGGLEPLRSCLGDGTGGGSSDDTKGKIPGMSFAEYNLDAARRLDECHLLALRSEANMIAVCAAVCGRQLTPREITQDHVETVEIETALRLALNLLAAHLDGQRRAA